MLQYFADCSGSSLWIERAIHLCWPCGMDKRVWSVHKVLGLMRGALLTSAGVSCYQYVLRSAPQDLRFVNVAGRLFTMHIHTWFHIQFNSYTYLFCHIDVLVAVVCSIHIHTYFIILWFGLVVCYLEVRWVIDLSIGVVVGSYWFSMIFSRIKRRKTQR